MRQYSQRISLTKNQRGIYCLDTLMGCSSGMENEAGGCYNDCYAAKAAKRYGYDFSTTVLRKFENWKHQREIIQQVSRIPLDFVRVGCSGDPSENWEHTLSVLKVIANANKEIVIITKHWTPLQAHNLEQLARMNVCVNTSVSALDKPEILANSLRQYHRLKPVCKSILRIVSCDFNTDNPTGARLSELQDKLFENESILDTVFRPSKTNPLVTDGTVNVKVGVFNGGQQLISKRNRKTYTGNCTNCREMCGLNINANYLYPHKPGTIKQLSMFTKITRP